MVDRKQREEIQEGTKVRYSPQRHVPSDPRPLPRPQSPVAETTCMCHLASHCICIFPPYIILINNIVLDISLSFLFCSQSATSLNYIAYG
jgi:hypothetical protein